MKQFPDLYHIYHPLFQIVVHHFLAPEKENMCSRGVIFKSSTIIQSGIDTDFNNINILLVILLLPKKGLQK